MGNKLTDAVKTQRNRLAAFIEANTPRNTRPAISRRRVFDEGLINPNQYTAQSANAFKDSALGMAGIIPGVGDYASGAQAADFWNRGEKGNALLAGLGALPLVPAIGGMFIGKGAKTWDAIKAQQANELLAKGIDPREVWKQTGTMRGADKALRQEIPDNLSALSRPLEHGRNNIALEKGFNHPGVYKSYPGAKKISYVPDSDKLTLGSYRNADGGGFLGESIKISDSAPDAKSTTLHELQHAIQQREGWARGGSPEAMKSEIPSEIDLTDARMIAARIAKGEAPSDAAEWIRKSLGRNPSVQAMDLGTSGTKAFMTTADPYRAYQRLAGEAEARLTQSRMNMTMPERLASYPPDMFDVPMDQQIVRMGDNGPAMATAYHGSPHKFDKFDMDKIGTGEGAQAYGHGLYFAEAPEVAKTYQTTLTMDRGFDYGGQKGLTRNQVQDMVNKEFGSKYADGVTLPSGVADRVIDDIVYGFNGGLPRTYKPGSERAKIYESIKNNIRHTDEGALYKVDIPDEAIPRMLDWDKPLSQQPAVLKTVFDKGLQHSLYRVHGNKNAGDFTGAELVRALGEKNATRILGEQGIPGIRYLDGNSRGAGGTSNYVLFDDQLPRILETNGVPTGAMSYADEAAQKPNQAIGLNGNPINPRGKVRK